MRLLERINTIFNIQHQRFFSRAFFFSFRVRFFSFSLFVCTFSRFSCALCFISFSPRIFLSFFKVHGEDEMMSQVMQYVMRARLKSEYEVLLNEDGPTLVRNNKKIVVVV